jgi:hypothetical protein
MEIFEGIAQLAVVDERVQRAAWCKQRPLVSEGSTPTRMSRGEDHGIVVVTNSRWIVAML